MCTFNFPHKCRHRILVLLIFMICSIDIIIELPQFSVLFVVFCFCFCFLINFQIVCAPIFRSNDRHLSIYSALGARYIHSPYGCCTMSTENNYFLWWWWLFAIIFAVSFRQISYRRVHCIVAYIRMLCERMADWIPFNAVHGSAVIDHAVWNSSNIHKWTGSTYKFSIQCLIKHGEISLNQSKTKKRWKNTPIEDLPHFTDAMNAE